MKIKIIIILKSHSATITEQKACECYLRIVTATLHEFILFLFLHLNND